MSQDMMSTLKGLLGDNADEKIQSVLSALGNSRSASDSEPASTPAPQASDLSSSQTNQVFNPDALEYIGKLKNIVDDMGKANDSRSNLLLSLKPYMRSERQKSIDNAIRLLNISKFSGLFKL